MHWLLSAREPTSAWTHFVWMILTIPAAALLVWLSRGRPLKQASMLVFGASLAFCMLGSALFHAVPLGVSDPFNALDHIGIYVLIAGTVTAIGTLGLRGSWRAGLLLLIWALAATGITVRLLADPPLLVRTSFYLVMGWVGVVTYFQLVRRLSHRQVGLIWIGGLLYSVGAVINVCQWPNFASWFNAHDLFHLFVMGGSLSHYLFLLVVLLQQREAPVPPRVAPAYPSLVPPVAARPQTVT
jgi:hemolysin III